MALSKSQLEQLRDMALLASSAYAGIAVPAGWTNITSSLTSLSSTYKKSGYYSNGNAQAAVFRDAAGRIVISIRGTDSSGDYTDDAGLAFGVRTYYQKFIPLIQAVRAQFPSAKFTFTGHSLGGAAVHELAGWNDARMAGSSFFAFSSPIFDNWTKVSDAGFVNDTVYGAVNNVSQADLRYLHYDSSSGASDIHSILNLADVLDRLGKTDAFKAAGGTYAMPTNAVIYAMGHSTFTGGSSNPNSGFTTPVYVIGRMAGDTIHGFNTFSVKQVIDGLGGNDNIYGGTSGINVLYGGTGNDVLTGNSAHDMLLGGIGNDKLMGGAGTDSLHGGSGVDTLTGGTGVDQFVFDAKADVGAGPDHITDFVHGTDKFVINDSAFGIAAGASFVVRTGTHPAPTTGAVTFLYDKATWLLSVDADGTGSGAAVALATLDNHPAVLSSGDILIV